MAVACDLPALTAASRCFLEFCNSEQEREAIQIYFMVQGLIGAGGTNFTNPATLLAAAKAWQALAETQLRAIDVYLSQVNAVANGATINTNINALKAAAKCYECFDPMAKKQVLEFLRCALSNLAKPD